MENLKQLPVLGSIIHILDTYPRMAAWFVLSTGIIILLAIEAQDVGLSTGNWIALILASIVVAGLCVWIVSWEDEEAEEPATVVKSEAKAAVEAETPKKEDIEDHTPASDG